jgi:deazaflavin-dependent oxidoreductase (nitroreductase family)
MSDSSITTHPPQGLSRFMWRLPIYLYKAHLGWLLGERFLLLTHTGRLSGESRQAVLEIIRIDKTTPTYYVVSGFGEKSDWFRNLQSNPEATIQVGRQRMHVRASRLNQEKAEAEFLDYARRHPTAIKNLAGMLGYQLDGSEANLRALAEVMPVVAFQPC